VIQPNEEARKEPFKHYQFAASMVRDGWRTPDCYSRNFSPAPQSPGVYLFSLYKMFWRESSSLPEIVYAGKSLNLAKRFDNHDVFPIISAQLPDFCLETGIHYMLQRWFRPLDKQIIDKAEIELIKKYNPPFNLQHRVKRVLYG
jgi:hypothetical protein